MTVLVVSPYAPYRDGIANYAVQEVAAMRRAGIDVEVLSPVPSAAHHHLALGSPRGWAALVKRAGRYERMVIQVFPELLFGGCRTAVERMLVWLAIAALGRRTELELRIHELEYDELAGSRTTRRVAALAVAGAARRSVHTPAEQADLTRALGPVGPVELVDHGRDFVARTTADRATARASLGVPDDATVFVTIGFVQRHKGFDRAVRAFQRLPEGAARLYVVGDVRIDHPDLVGYRDELDQLIAATPGAERRSGYVSDEEFDRWIVAADRIVLPYREIWSSGVVERAALLDRPVITTPVGGLRDQARADTVLVADDAELAAALAEAADVDLRPVAADVGTTQAELQAAVRRRAHGDDGSTPTIAASLSRHGLSALGSPASPRPPVRLLKTVIHRLTAWQVEPLVRDVNEFILGANEAVEALEHRIDDVTPPGGNPR